MGPGAVVIKRGDAGALFFSQDGVFAAPAFPLERVVDPTGAGDSFAGGCMGWLARTGDISPAGIRTALVVGSVRLRSAWKTSAWIAFDHSTSLPFAPAAPPLWT